ncbi:MAG: cell division protein FtsZ [Bacteroidia bacterium]|jgi:cell division protein FtsZ
MMKFDLNQDNSAIIKVIGVGGGGSNAVNHMYKQGIKGVDFFVCNTDQQSLDMSPVPSKIVLGASLTKGRGAGSLPEVGRNAAIETIEEIKALLGNNTEMVFITAGLGGGTGTGAAPIIAKAAKELGILTVGIVTIPFGFEGKKRKAQADSGLEALKQNVDTLLVISNDKLREIYGNLKVTEAFGHADDILSTAAKGIADIITTTLQINTDINDVKTVMRDSGVAIMGSALASGENRALRAVEQAMASPLLNDSDIRGARYVLVNITCGEDEITMDELGEITDYIQDAAGMTAEVIKGYGVDMSLGDKVSVTIIATGFDAKGSVGSKFEKPAERILHILQDETKKTETPVTPVVNVTPVVETPVVNTTPKVDEMVSFVREVEEEVKPVVNEEQETVSSEPFMFIKKDEPLTETKEEQATFQFEITNNTTETPSNEWADTTIDDWNNEPSMTSEPTIEETENTIVAKVQNEEQMKKAQDRVSRLKELNFKLLKTPNGLSELENEPAYKRRNINLDSTPHSSESQVSRYTLSEGDDKKIEIKPNNSFLHDNVD